MRKADKIFEEYTSEVKNTTEKCIQDILRSIRDEISLTLGDIDELVLEEREGGTVYNRAMTELSLCEYMSEELLVLKNLFKVKENALRH